MGAGDILLVRTGHARRLAELGAWDTDAARAGLHPTAARFLADRGVAALGSDGNNDTAPSTTEGVAFPIHVLALNAMGMPFDYLQFEDLMGHCETEHRWEFLFVGLRCGSAKAPGRRSIRSRSSEAHQLALACASVAVTIASVARGSRYLTGVAAAVGVLALVPAGAMGSQLFKSGRTAGEITAHSAIVWARVIRPVTLRARVARDRSFRHRVARAVIKAKPRNDLTVQRRIRGLRPNRTYWYRFCTRRTHRCSGKGRFETAPARGTTKTIRFAYTGDETGVREPGGDRPFWGRFRAFRSIVAEKNDFNIDFADTMYSDPEVPGWANRTALSVPDKWAMYRRKLRLGNMRRVRAATGMYNHWDDHEFRNDFSIPEFGRKVYKHGVRAFRDYEPIRYSKQTGIYRTVRWGKNLELFFLDERSFRSAKASANATCDNPATGSPDFAPTAPKRTRDQFAPVLPSLAEPVSQQCKRKINSPNRTMLGKPQFQRFLRDVKSSNARWKVVMNEVPIQQFYTDPYDRWEGYAHERVQLLKSLERANVKDLVFLTTDTHAAFANNARLRTLDGDVAPANAPAAAPTNSPYDDFIIGPVATRPYAQEIDNATGRPGTGDLAERLFFKPPPPAGVGMACAQGDQNSYAEVTVKKGSLRIDYKKDGGSRVKDVDGSPCGPYVLTR